MVAIVFKDEVLETNQETIKYTKQVNDIAELETRQTSFTSSFDLPKTPQITQAFEQLGIVGDTSQVPYLRNDVQLFDNGTPLIYKGWLNVIETNAKGYKCNLYDGIIDFFKAIDNKTFGDDIDLSEIDHSKDLTTIINSFTNENYRYIINDYGGKTHTDTLTSINIDYLVPSARVKYLWNKIFTTFGFEYEGDVFETADFDGLWLTYPKAPIQDGDDTLEDYAGLGDFNGNVFQTIDLIQGTLINNAVYVVPQTGSYKLTFYADKSFENPDGSIEYVPLPLIINNGALTIMSSPLTSNGINIQLNQGDTLNFPYVLNADDLGIEDILGSITVEKYAQQISFSEELKQLSISDFFKEILWRFSLTIFVDIDGKLIFKTFDERLQADVIDWSEKYLERTSERYVPKSYAQKNIFSQNYNDKEESFNNGNFTISNKNLKERFTIISSKIFSPDKTFESFVINSTHKEIFYQTPLWDKEVTENDDTQKVKYKELSSRFYLLRSETISKTTILASESLSLQQNVFSLPVARFFMTTFKDFVPKYYNNIKLMLEDFRMHKITLHLNYLDVLNLDFDKIYYFNQEANYYILNKLDYESNKDAKAEFIRIKYAEQ